MADIDEECIRYDNYNTMIIMVLTDSSGDRDEAERIIKDRPALKQAIIDYTKEKSSTISPLSIGLFKMMTKIPGIYYSDEYYVNMFLCEFFPITSGDVKARKKYVNALCSNFKSLFDQIQIASDLQTGIPYIRDGYYHLMDEASLMSHVFLMILMEPSILKDLTHKHYLSLFIYSMFTYRNVGNTPRHIRMHIPTSKSYTLISTLYEIVTKNPDVFEQASDEIMELVEKWLCDNEPQFNHVKSANKSEFV